MSKRWPRYLLVLVLTMVFLTFLASSCQKYNKGLVGMSMQKKPRTAFVFPTVGICGILVNASVDLALNGSNAEFGPWIKGALLDYIEEEESANGAESGDDHIPE